MNETSSSLWPTVRREPLVHFLGIAVLLFVANTVFSGDERETIVVDWSTQQFLIQQQEDLLLRPLSEQDKQEIIDNFVEEEIFVREARKRGFDSSSRIRTLLIQNMRFFISSDVPAPTEEDLRRYFEDNADKFATTPTVSYDHVLFVDPDAVPEGTLEQLRSGVDHTRMGDADNLISKRLVQINQRRVAATFGPQVAPEVLAIADDEWHGPFLSGQGAHFLRVAERHPARRPAFEEIENWIDGEWTLTKSRELIDTELENLMQSYRVEIIGPGEEPG